MSTAAYHIVIPARLASQRLPNKPLIPIAGKPLIEHVWLRATQAGAKSAVIATDSEEILSAARGFGAQAVLTSADHESGSDRIAECADIMGWDDDTVLVNLQGDEPLMPPACLDQAAGLLLAAPGAAVASLYWPLEDATEVEDPNVVKVVVSQDGTALYFSRSVIPHPRGVKDLQGVMGSGAGWKRHIGLYAYRAAALRAFAAARPTPLETTEKLEQLRFLESGRSIVMAQACEHIPAGVDTQEDLQRIRDLKGASQAR